MLCFWVGARVGPKQVHVAPKTDNHNEQSNAHAPTKGLLALCAPVMKYVYQSQQLGNRRDYQHTRRPGRRKANIELAQYHVGKWSRDSAFDSERRDASKVRDNLIEF